MNYYLGALKKYAVFSGRARRKEYWYFVLFYILVFFVFVAIDTALTGDTGLFSGIYILFILIPGISVGVRRLHDTNHSGWWYFLSLIPLVGPIILLVFFIRDSQPGENRYGPNPKGIGNPPSESKNETLNPSQT